MQHYRENMRTYLIHVHTQLSVQYSELYYLWERHVFRMQNKGLPYAFQSTENPRDKMAKKANLSKMLEMLLSCNNYRPCTGNL